MSVFGVILVHIFPYSVRMRENTGQNNSEYGHLLRSYWMNTLPKHCSRLNNKCFDTALTGDSLITGLTCYRKVWNEFFQPLNVLNCGIESDKMQHVLWQAHDSRSFSSLRNVFRQWRYQDSPEHVRNGLLKIASCLKQWNNSTNVFICGILPRDYIYSVNCLLIKETNHKIHTGFLKWLP